MTQVKKSRMTPAVLISTMQDIVKSLIEDFDFGATPLQPVDFANYRDAIEAIEKCLREASSDAAAMRLAEMLITQGWAGGIADRFSEKADDAA